ncbi:twitching motility protein PilT [Spirochaetia bacterium]|nr:twitching motility protein PilT [Spirochaetia bacterium]
MKYLLDTNVLSEIRKPNRNPKVYEFVKKIRQIDLSISVISIGEIVFGMEKLPEGKKRAGRTLPYNDSLIATTALAHGLTLLTRNIRDFAAVEGLSLSNPWD